MPHAVNKLKTAHKTAVTIIARFMLIVLFVLEPLFAPLKGCVTAVVGVSVGTLSKVETGVVLLLIAAAEMLAKAGVPVALRAATKAAFEVAVDIAA